MKFPAYPPDILSRADALLSEKYPDGIVDPRFVEIACEAMMLERADWRPIETAPRDGNPVFVWSENDAYDEPYAVGRWRKGAWTRESDDYDLIIEPTLWRPIYAPRPGTK